MTTGTRNIPSNEVADEAAAAYALKHTQGTDTTLGSMAANVDMNSHKLTNLSVPANAGDSMRSTAKITEAAMEDAADKKHTAGTDQGLDTGGDNAVTAEQLKTLKDVIVPAKMDKPPYDVMQPMGGPGADLGVCNPANLPPGMTPLAGYDIPTSPNYGNYQYADGSICCYRPKRYLKVGNGTNGLAVNKFDMKGIDVFPTTAEANAAGYMLMREFVDGGEEKAGRFFDKYMGSKNAWGTGYISSSIKNGNPISCHPDHNPIADLTACSVNQLYEAINAAHARDGVNGAVNPSSIWSERSIFDSGGIFLATLAHGQAAGGTAYCAWYDPAGATNYPKGCDNNALGSMDDASVIFTTDGYSNCGKTGSGLAFAKTTHNGQECGIADVAGLMHEVSIGITCIATSPAIEAMSQTNPCQITVTGHGKETGDYVQINSITQANWSGAKDKIFTLTKISDDIFSIPFDASGFGTAYDPVTDPGTVTIGKFYVAKEATAMKDFTSGDSAATDHWGATGVAAMMQAFIPAFETVYPNNVFIQRLGSGANQVFSEDTSGNGWLLTCMGFPKDAGGIDATGTNTFGKDCFYQNIINGQCVLSCAAWSGGSTVGAGTSALNSSRTHSHHHVGLRFGCYPNS